MVETVNFGYNSLGIATTDVHLFRGARDFSPEVHLINSVCRPVVLHLQHGVLKVISHQVHAWGCTAIVCVCGQSFADLFF